MTDWDVSIDQTDTAKGAFVAFCACALVFLISKPFDLYARLSDRLRSHSDSARDDAGADWSAEGSFQNHNGQGL